MYAPLTSMRHWSYSFARTLSDDQNPASSHMTQHHENIDILKITYDISIIASSELSRFAPPIKNLFWYHEVVTVL